jgi:CarD family transcriptional regulator
MFQVEDNVVYPTYGLAQVVALENRKVLGKEQSFYKLRIRKNNLHVMIPVDSAEKVGLREIISPEDVDMVFEILGQKSSTSKTPWHHRFNKNVKKLKTGSIFETAEVMRDLMVLNSMKSLAIKETRMMNRAKKLVVSEIAFSQDIPEEEVERKIEAALQLKTTAII